MRVAAALLILAYLFTLAMSSAHLSSWYATSLGALPPWLAWGLAGALEFTAFMLSMISTFLRGSRWAAGGAIAALGLVWTGNAISMHRAAPQLALWETLAMSAFVPIGTFVVGKVVGELLARSTLEPEVAQEEDQGPRTGTHSGATLPPRGYRLAPPGTPSPSTLEPEAAQEEDQGPRATAPDKEREHQLLAALVSGPASLGQLAARLGWPKSSTRRWLARLERQGVVRRGPDGWEVVP